MESNDQASKDQAELSAAQALTALDLALEAGGELTIERVGADEYVGRWWKDELGDPTETAGRSLRGLIASLAVAISTENPSQE